MDTSFSATTLAARVGDFLFPEACLECGKRIAVQSLFCDKCKKAKPLEWVSAIHGSSAWARHYLFCYEGTGKTLFKAAKFNERRRAQNFLIEEARLHLASFIDDKTCFIAIPSRHKFLAKLLKACVPKQQLVLDALRIKQSFFSKSANKTLSAAERYARIYEKLQWNESKKLLPTFERYVLCDDVSTSGATLERAAHLLKTNLNLADAQIALWALMYRPRLLDAATS